MKKESILIIYGSPRKEGLLYEAYKDIELRLNENKDNSIDIIDLNKENIKDCISCFYCKEHLQCVIRDDMDKVYEKIEKANKILLVSPVFYGHITGLLKSCIDRFFCYSKIDMDTVNRKNKYSSIIEDEKKLYLLVSHGNSRPEVLESIERSIRYAAVDINASLELVHFMGPLDFDFDRDELKKEAVEKIISEIK